MLGVKIKQFIIANGMNTNKETSSSIFYKYLLKFHFTRHKFSSCLLSLKQQYPSMFNFIMTFSTITSTEFF